MGWFDAPTWIHTTLTDGLPGWYVAPEDDVQDRTFPACLFDVALTELDYRGLWEGNLTLNLLMPTERVPDLLGEVTTLIGSWRPPGPAVDVALLTATKRSTNLREDLTLYTLVYTIVWATN